jgi:uncharacterized BrkB/YihY/UPF0761 family membrane protein
MKPAPVISVVREAIELWTAHNSFQHAGALAFCTLFSLAPLVIILITIIGPSRVPSSISTLLPSPRQRATNGLRR